MPETNETRRVATIDTFHLLIDVLADRGIKLVDITIDVPEPDALAAMLVAAGAELRHPVEARLFEDTSTSYLVRWRSGVVKLGDVTVGIGSPATSECLPRPDAAVVAPAEAVL